MTTPAPAVTTAPDARRARLAIVVVAVVLIGAAVAWVWRGGIWQWDMWINGANKREYFDMLLAERDPALLDKLEAAMRDESKGVLVRVAVARVLMLKDRLALVEKALREGELGTRTTALQALFEGRFFAQYANDPAYRVRDTLLDWLRRDGDDSRDSAINMLNEPFLKTPEAVPLIRAILAAPPGPGGAPSAGANLRVAAANAIDVYRDCEGAALVVAMAGNDPNPLARLRAVQAVERLYSVEGSPCGAQLPEAAVRDLVVGALSQPGADGESRALRMGALGILAKRPGWAQGHVDAIRARFAPEVHPAERRTAFAALLVIADPKAVEDLPRAFHDPAAEIRGQALQALIPGKPPFDDPRYRSCLIGFVRDEADAANNWRFEEAIVRLHEMAGTWVGFPAKRASSKGAPETTMRKYLQGLFQTGEAEGVTRASLGDAWFRWYATSSGRDAAGVEAAVKARDEFWSKAKAGDIAGAQAALVGPEGSSKPPDLFTYEEGWLKAHGG